jgi:hypothetical protein
VTARPAPDHPSLAPPRGHGHLSQRSLLRTPSHPIPQKGPVIIEAHEAADVRRQFTDQRIYVDNAPVDSLLE